MFVLILEVKPKLNIGRQDRKQMECGKSGGIVTAAS